MATQKITKKDILAGRIYRCENCETKCDDYHKIHTNKLSWGQSQGEVITEYYCSASCADYAFREQTRPSFQENLDKANQEIAILTGILSRAVKRGEVVYGLFELLRFWKTTKTATEMLFSMTHTFAELAVAFHKARDASYELSEIIRVKTPEQVEEDNHFAVMTYNVSLNFVTWYGNMMTDDGLNPWL